MELDEAETTLTVRLNWRSHMGNQVNSYQDLLSKRQKAKPAGCCLNKACILGNDVAGSKRNRRMRIVTTSRELTDCPGCGHALFWTVRGMASAAE